MLKLHWQNGNVSVLKTDGSFAGEKVQSLFTAFCSSKLMEKLSGYEPGIRRSNRLRNTYIPFAKWKRHEISNLTFAGPNPAGDICRYGEIGYHASLIRRYFLFESGYLYCGRSTNG